MLEDSRVLKVGPRSESVIYLFNDFGIEVVDFYDLNFMKERAYDKESAIYSILLEPYCCWDEYDLTYSKIYDAAKSVYGAMEFFKFFARKIRKIGWFEAESDYIQNIINTSFWKNCVFGEVHRPFDYIEYNALEKVYSGSYNQPESFHIVTQNRCLVCKKSKKFHKYFPCKRISK